MLAQSFDKWMLAKFLIRRNHYTLQTHSPSCSQNQTPNCFQGLVSRGFAHYRFHKRVGKGNWNRYIERYTKPRGIENTQPIIFNYKASFKTAKNSAAYLWELPKRIAASTTANEIFSAWVLYRHKKKKLYHYILALRRLCDVKNVDISDWRFQLIAKKVIKKSRYFIDLPSVCYYLGKLKAASLIDKLSVALSEKIELYSANQLAKIARGFGYVVLHDKHLFSLLAKRFQAIIATASNESLIDVARAFGKCMVYNYKLLMTISLSMQNRIHNISLVEHVEPDQVATGAKHCMLNLSTTPAVVMDAPTLTQMVKLGTLNPIIIMFLAEGFALCKYQDLVILDWISQKLQGRLLKSLNSKEDNVNYEIPNPHLTTTVVGIFCKLKVNDVVLFETILDHVSTYPFDYPPKCIAEICKQLCVVLPKQIPSISEKFRICWNHICEHLHLLPPHELVNAAVFAYKTLPVNVKTKVLDDVCGLICNNGLEFHKAYDAPKLMETLSMHHNINDQAFQILTRDIYKVVRDFEPCDFARTARVLVRLINTTAMYQRKLKRKGIVNIKMVNMLSKYVIERCEEFDRYSYHCTARDLTLAGPPQDSILKHMWAYNRIPRGFQPPNFKNKVQTNSSVTDDQNSH
ncbi:uncharacterized protein BdWA1_003559 [Babesia duncani]|nr:hypothetical protein BdWA1_003559 [Babesia duncani]